MTDKKIKAEEKIPSRYLQQANIVLAVNDAGVMRVVKNRWGDTTPSAIWKFMCSICGQDKDDEIHEGPAETEGLHLFEPCDPEVLMIDMDGAAVILVRDDAGPVLGDGLLTQDEHDAMALSVALANKIGKIIRSNKSGQEDNDWNEAAQRIHAVQHTILAQAAARAYPGVYRLLGGWPSDEAGS